VGLLKLLEQGKDQEDVVYRFIHLEGSNHDLDDVVNRLRGLEVLSNVLLFLALIAEKDALKVVVEANKLHEPFECGLGFYIV